MKKLETISYIKNLERGYKGMSEFKVNTESLMIEYAFLENQIKDLDTLYKDTKQMIDINNESMGKRNYVFLASQTASLSSIISNKTAVISKMNEIRFKIEDMKIKEYNINKGSEPEGGVAAAISKEMFKMFMSAGRSGIADQITEDLQFQQGDT